MNLIEPALDAIVVDDLAPAHLLYDKEADRLRQLLVNFKSVLDSSDADERAIVRHIRETRA